MLHTVPRIDDPESMFGYTRSGTSQDYILLGPPSPIRGPTFENVWKIPLSRSYSIEVTLDTWNTSLIRSWSFTRSP